MSYNALHVHSHDWYALNIVLVPAWTTKDGWIEGSKVVNNVKLQCLNMALRCVLRIHRIGQVNPKLDLGFQTQLLYISKWSRILIMVLGIASMFWCVLFMHWVRGSHDALRWGRPHSSKSDCFHWERKIEGQSRYVLRNCCYWWAETAEWCVPEELWKGWRGVVFFLPCINIHMEL